MSNHEASTSIGWWRLLGSSNRFESLREESGWSENSPGRASRIGRTLRGEEQARLDAITPRLQVLCDGTVHSIDTSSDKKMLATGDSTGALILWRTRDASVIRTIQLAGAVYRVDLSKDKTQVLSCCESGEATVWETATGDSLMKFACGSPVSCGEISSDKLLVVTGDEGGSARVWDAMSGENTLAVSCGARIRSVDLSGDSKWFVTGDNARRATIWDAFTGQIVRVITCTHEVYSVKLSVDQRLLATGDAMCKAKIWDVPTGKLKQTMDCGGWVYSVYFSGDGTMLATGDQGKTARLWNVSTGQLLYKLDCESDVYCVDLSGDKSVLSVGDGSGTVCLWDTATGAARATMECGPSDVLFIDMSATLIATAGPGKYVKLWDLEKGRLLHTCNTNGVAFACDLGDANVMASGDASGQAVLWDTETGEQQRVIIVLEKGGPVFSVKLSKGNQKLVTGDVKGAACVWDTATGSLLQKMGDGIPVRSVDITDDEKMLATGTRDGRTVLWDVKSARALRTMQCGGQVYSVDMSGDGRLVATGDQHKMATIWEIKTGRVVQKMDCGDVVKRVDLSGDCTLLAAGVGGDCILWDVPSGKKVQTFDGGGRVKMSSDKRLLATVDASGRCTLVQLLHPSVTAFWAKMVHDPIALAAAAGCLPSHELLLYGTSTSGRTLVAHAAAAGNQQVLEALFALPARPVASAILQTDCTGRHALDHALKNHNGRVAELLFAYALERTPHTRTPLVVSATERDPPALVLMSKLCPGALQKQLNLLGLDMLPGLSLAESLRRAPARALNCDHNRMALAGADTPFADQKIWEKLRSGGITTSSRFRLGITHAVLVAKRFIEQFFAGDYGDEEPEVEVRLGIVGIPRLFLHSKVPQSDIFRVCVDAAEQQIDIMASKVMRAAVAFKWQAFGHRMWITELVLFATFLSSYMLGTSLLISPDPGPHDRFLGALLFTCTQLINLNYGWYELRELYANGWEYFASAQNICDLASIFNVFSIVPLILLHDVNANGAAAIGTVLMIPKMASIARGAEKYSFLVSMLTECIKDMVPFLSLCAFVLLANTFAFQLVSPPGSADFGDFKSAWFSSYALALGEFDPLVFTDSALMGYFFHYFTLLVSVLLLNVLIAIISDTYERVQEKLLPRSLLERAKLLLEMQHRMRNKYLQDSALYPKWVHIIERVEDVGGNNEAWSGRLHAIKEHVSVLEGKLADSESRLTTSFTEELSAVRDELRSCESHIIKALGRNNAFIEKVSTSNAAEMKRTSKAQPAAEDSAEKPGALLRPNKHESTPSRPGVFARAPSRAMLDTAQPPPQSFTKLESKVDLALTRFEHVATIERKVEQTSRKLDDLKVEFSTMRGQLDQLCSVPHVAARSATDRALPVAAASETAPASASTAAPSSTLPSPRRVQIPSQFSGAPQ